MTSDRGESTLVNRVARILLGIAISLFLIWKTYSILLEKGVSPDSVKIGAGAVTAAIAAILVAYHFRVVRWRYSLSVITDEPGIRALYGPLYAGFAINGLVPLRAGDIYRVLAIQKRFSIDYAKGLATLLIERVFDFAGILIILSFSLVAVGDVEILGISGRNIALLAGLLAVIVLLATLFGNLLDRFMKWFVTIREWPAIVSKVLRFLGATLANVCLFNTRRIYLRLLGMSILIWATEGTVAYLIVSRAHVFLEAWVASAVANLGTLIPSTPGHIGTFDYFMSMTLESFGYATREAAVATLIVHLVIWLPVTILGVVTLLFLQNVHSADCKEMS